MRGVHTFSPFWASLEGIIQTASSASSLSFYERVRPLTWWAPIRVRSPKCFLISRQFVVHHLLSLPQQLSTHLHICSQITKNILFKSISLLQRKYSCHLIFIFYMNYASGENDENIHILEVQCGSQNSYILFFSIIIWIFCIWRGVGIAFWTTNLILFFKCLGRLIYTFITHRVTCEHKAIDGSS